MKRMLVLTALAWGVLGVSGYAHAHGNEVHADVPKATHGGQVQPAGANFLELVVVKNSKEPANNPVTVFITDAQGKKISSTGASGTATLLNGSNKTVVTLSPDGDNRLKGSGTYASAPAMKAIVAVSMPGKPTEQARFKPLAPDDGHADPMH